MKAIVPLALVLGVCGLAVAAGDKRQSGRNMEVRI